MPDPTPPVDLSRHDFGVYDPPMSEQTPIPAEALEAAAKVALRRYESEHYVSPDVTWQSFVAEVHEFVEVVAPILLAAGRTAAAADIRAEIVTGSELPAIAAMNAAYEHAARIVESGAARVAENGADQ